MGGLCSCLDRPRNGLRMSRFRKYLTYQTVKITQIDDLCLGTLHYAFMAAIFMWVAVYQIGYQTTYIKFEAPIGSVRTSLQGPTKVIDGFACDPTRPPTKPGDEYCTYDFTNPKDLVYCAQSGEATYGPEGNQVTLPCKDWDQFDVVSPVTGSDVLYISTRVQETNGSLACEFPEGSNTCHQTYQMGCDHSYAYDKDCHPADVAQMNYYVADIERFTMLVDHSVRSPTVKSVHGDSSSMDGNLISCDGTVIEPNSTVGGQDILSIGQMLQAATHSGGCGYSLDGVSTVHGSKNTSRYDGVVMALTISYHNVKPWQGRQSNISYSYRVEVLEGTKSKVPRQIFKEYPHLRTTRDMHGIKLVVLQTGQLGAFDATTLLLQLSTSTALLAVSTVVVDQLAIRVLPYRKAYRDAKVDEIRVGEKMQPLLLNPKKASQATLRVQDDSDDDF